MTPDSVEARPLPPVEELAPLFPFLDRDEVRVFCSYLEMKEFPSDYVLMREGEAGDYMGFLVGGKLAVKKETSFPGRYILIAVIEPGSMVGEISVVEKGFRNATVVTMEPSRLLILTYDQMEKMLGQHPALGIKLLKRIIHVIGYRLRKASERLSLIL